MRGLCENGAHGGSAPKPTRTARADLYVLRMGHEEKWNAKCRDLEAFKAKQGHCNVPRGHGNMGRWVADQRTARKNEKLCEDRVQKLDALGFDWALKLTWNERLDELTKYKAEHGHCNVPRSHESLGRWVDKQRVKRKKGKLLSEERVQKLGDIGFVWNPTPSWDERLGELVKYKAEHGDCNVPQSQGSLGTWVNNQRIARKRGKLSEERARKLDALGFDWSPRSTQPTWEESLGELTEYKAEHGHCNVPMRQGSLGKWVDSQRQAYKNGQMDVGRVQKLEGIDFVWNHSWHTADVGRAPQRADGVQDRAWRLQGSGKSRISGCVGGRSTHRAQEGQTI